MGNNLPPGSVCCIMRSGAAGRSHLRRPQAPSAARNSPVRSAYPFNGKRLEGNRVLAAVRPPQKNLGTGTNFLKNVEIRASPRFFLEFAAVRGNGGIGLPPRPGREKGKKLAMWSSGGTTVRRKNRAYSGWKTWFSPLLWVCMALFTWRAGTGLGGHRARRQDFLAERFDNALLMVHTPKLEQSFLCEPRRARKARYGKGLGSQSRRRVA